MWVESGKQYVANKEESESDDYPWGSEDNEENANEDISDLAQVQRVHTSVPWCKSIWVHDKLKSSPKTLEKLPVEEKTIENRKTKAKKPTKRKSTAKKPKKLKSKGKEPKKLESKEKKPKKRNLKGKKPKKKCSVRKYPRHSYKLRSRKVRHTLFS